MLFISINYFMEYMKMKIFVLLLGFLLVSGSSGVQKDRLSVMEGDSITLNTDKLITTNQGRIRWYWNDIRIAQFLGDPGTACTDVQCENGDERFRDRLKLDHVNGSLTITNIRTTDSGEYKLHISGISETIFSVAVRGVPEWDKIKRKSVKEGESVTLDPGVMKNTNDSMTWFFNDTLIAEITGGLSQICRDVQCKERFRDRLKLDHQTGSLTITNIRNTDTGVYKLEIISSSSTGRRRRSISITSVKSFSITVIDLGLSLGAVAAIAVVVLLVFATLTVAVIYRLRRQNENVI